MNEDTGRLAGSRPSDEAVPSSPEASIPSAVPPIILVRVDDPQQKPQLYACGKCGAAHSPRIYACRDDLAHETARKAAENCYSCKTHNICACGAECPKYWTACADCRLKKKLAAATEIPDDGGPYFEFGGDRYYHEIEDAAEDGVEWVCPCTVTYPQISGDDVLDGLLCDMHEDASIDDLDAVAEFMAAVDAFNKAQTTASYWGDETRKIRVPAQAIEARQGGNEVPSQDESAVPKECAQPSGGDQQ